jgi:dihydrolipoamide dehydrogenase
MTKRVVIIGGGSGGYPAAFLLAQKGASVTLVEKDRLGGTCVNRGCIPTKVLLHATGVLREIRSADRMGIRTGDIDLDFTQLTKYKDDVVSSLVGGVERLCSGRKIHVIHGTAFFEAPRRLRIKETGEVLEGDAVIVATGSVPATVPIEGSDDEGILTSDDALALKRIPSSIVIIGAGYIGLEFAQIFRSLGAEVTVLELLDQVLPSEDTEVASTLQKALRQEGIGILTGADVRKISGPAGRKTIEYVFKGKSKSVEADSVLMAVGRRSYTEALGLERVGVRTEKGCVVVNKWMETTAPGIYAVGDVVGGLMLAHVATAEAHTAFDQILGDGQPMDYTAVPRCIYTYPEATSVGLKEAEAKERHGEVVVGRFPLRASGKARILGALGFAKVIAEKRYGRIVGVHLVGPHATDMISEAALAMNLECTAEELAHTIHPHPTLSEIFMESAMSIEGYKIHSV